eukprot:jgi/Undpi1/2109/HiC_scaffold_12.g05495.m1
MGWRGGRLGWAGVGWGVGWAGLGWAGLGWAGVGWGGGGGVVFSFVRAGILGIPFASRQGGLILSSGVLALVGVVCTYCMWMLIRCKYRVLALRGKDNTGPVKYPDICQEALGRGGLIAVESALVASQAGFSTAYLVFIARNLHALFEFRKTPVILLCVPGLVLMCLIKHLKYLAPFSLIAEIVNLTGLAVVFFDDAEFMGINHESISLAHWKAFPFVFGVGVYCFEGMGMVIPVEESMIKRENFTPILSMVMIIYTTLCVLSGALGYLAFGNETEDIVLLNIGSSASTLIVKLSFCIGLYFTFPIIDGTRPAVFFVGVEKDAGELAGLGGDDLGADAGELTGLADDGLRADLLGGMVVSVPDDFLAAAEAGAGDEAEATRRTDDDDRLAKLLMVPVWEVLEFKWLRRQSPSYGRDRNALRAGIVFGTGVLACAVPNFGLFVSLIGSSCCSLLAFILPTLCYSRLERNAGFPLSPARTVVNRIILASGVFAMASGTIDTLHRIGIEYGAGRMSPRVPRSTNVLRAGKTERDEKAKRDVRFRVLAIHFFAVAAQLAALAKYTIPATDMSCLATHRMMLFFTLLYDAYLVMFLLGKIEVTRKDQKLPCWQRAVIWWSLFSARVYLPLMAVILAATFPGGVDDERKTCFNGIEDTDEYSAGRRNTNTFGYLINNCMLMIEFVLLLALFLEPVLHNPAGQTEKNRNTLVRNVVCTAIMIVAYAVGTVLVVTALMTISSTNQAAVFYADLTPLVQMFVTLCATEIALTYGVKSVIRHFSERSQPLIRETAITSPHESRSNPLPTPANSNRVTTVVIPMESDMEM